jgi:hypothetical protein
MSRSNNPIRLAITLAGAIATLLIGGCSTTVEGKPAADPAPVPTEGPGSDPVAWTDRLCGAVVAFAEPAAAKPDYNAAGDLPAVKRTFTDYLASVVTGVQKGRAQLGTIGRSPVPGGDEIVGKAQNALTFLEQDFAGARASMDATDANNAETFLAALTHAEATVKGIKPPNVLADAAAVPRLKTAAQSAPQCQTLSTMAGAAPR